MSRMIIEHNNNGEIINFEYELNGGKGPVARYVYIKRIKPGQFLFYGEPAKVKDSFGLTHQQKAIAIKLDIAITSSKQYGFSEKNGHLFKDKQGKDVKMFLAKFTDEVYNLKGIYNSTNWQYEYPIYKDREKGFYLINYEYLIQI